MSDPCFGIERAFQHPSVRFGWYPAMVVAGEGIDIRSMPDLYEGLILKHVPNKGGLAVQSTRNPQRDSDPQDLLLSPHKRPSVKDSLGNEHIWVGTRAGWIQGWVLKSAVGPDPNAASKPPLLGPAGFDFEVGRTMPRWKKPNGCGKVSLTKPLRRVVHKTVYLRASGRGSGTHHMHENDVVQLLIVDGPAGFAFCEVVNPASPAASVWKGCRGWISQQSLAR